MAAGRIAGPGPGPRLLVAAAVAVAAFSIWLRTGFPTSAWPAAGADDALFVGNAAHLLAGKWLGPYSQLTLVKGMGFPLFIAAAFLTGVPLVIAEQVVYLAACALAMQVAVRAESRGHPRWGLGFVLFCALALHPVLFSADLARVVREGLYISQALAILALACAVGVPWDPSRSVARRAALGVALGLLLGWFWLTREEGVWLLPPLATVAGIGAVASLRRAEGTRWRRAAGFAIPWGAAVGVALISVIAVAAINHREYRGFMTNELKSAAFREAYGALSRIRPAHWQRYIVFPLDVRERAYAVSPAARELVPGLEGPDGQRWAATGCRYVAMQPCTGFHAGWFLWALRGAVALSGHYGNAADAQRFYRRLAREIDTACAEGRLDCLPPRATLAPPFRWSYLADTLRELPVLLRITLKVDRDTIGAPPSSGSAAAVDGMSDLVGPAAPSEARHLSIQGWAAAAGGLPVLALRCAGYGATRLSVLPPVWVPESLAGRQAVAFDIETGSPPGPCALVAQAPGAVMGAAALSVPLARLTSGSSAGDERLMLVVQASLDQPVAPGTAARRAVLERIARCLAAFYDAILPVGGILGLAGLAAGTLYRGRNAVPPALLAFGWASAVAVACRAVLLAYLQVTAIPSALQLYASPAMPLLVVVVVLGVYAGLCVAWAAWRRRPPQEAAMAM